MDLMSLELAMCPRIDVSRKEALVVLRTRVVFYLSYCLGLVDQACSIDFLSSAHYLQLVVSRLKFQTLFPPLNEYQLL